MEKEAQYWMKPTRKQRNPQSFQGFNNPQKEAPYSHKLQDHVHE